MGTCAICGQKAGLFSGVHKQCQGSRTSALASMRQRARDALVGENFAILELSVGEKTRANLAEEREAGEIPPSQRVSGFWDRCAGLMKQGNLSRGLCHGAIVDGWLDAAEWAFARWAAVGVPATLLEAVKASDKEFGLSVREERLIEARQLLRLSRVKSQVLSQEPIERVPFDAIPAQGEGIFWTLSPSTYSRQVSITTHAGGFGGVSVRVAPGVYVRSGGYQGESQPAHRLEPIGTGTVAMSNLQTWFKCDQEITRFPHDRLISTQAFTDAFSLTPSTGSPVFFSLPKSERFPGVLGALLVGLATVLAAIVKNRGQVVFI